MVIEPGPLRVEIEERRYRRFSYAKLQALLGEERTYELRRRIERTLFRCLIVSVDHNHNHADNPQTTSTRNPHSGGRDTQFPSVVIQIKLQR